MYSSKINNYVCYVVLLAIHVGFVWALPYFPTQDGPSHVYNLVILRDLLLGGRDWGSYFSYQLHAVPNLGFNVITYPLLSVLSPFAAEKLFISIYMLLMGISVPILLRTFGRNPFPFAFLVFPVIFNFAMLKGFYSFIIAVPPFLLAFSLAWKIRKSSLACRAIILNMSAFILFYLHLLAFVFYLLSLTAIIVAETGGVRRAVRSLAALFLILCPVLVNLVFYLRNGMESFKPDFVYKLTLFRINNLISDLVLFSTVNLSPWQLLPATLFVTIIIACGCRPIKEICHRRLNGENHDSGAMVILLLATSLLLIYFSCHGVYFNQRIPWVILLILLPLLRMPASYFFNQYGPMLIVATVVLFFAIDAGVMWQQSAKVRSFLSGLEYALPKGAPVLTYKRNKIEWSRVDVLLHAASYYGVLAGSVDLGNYESGLYQFPVRFLPRVGSVPNSKRVSYEPENIEWSDYPAIRFLIGWEVDANDGECLRKSFHPVWGNGALTIWQRND
jgi:hypothetical protein